MKIQLKIINYLLIFKFIVPLIAVIATLILFFFTLDKSLGGTFNYIIFSSLSIILLIIGLIQRKSVVYMLFSILIYLGFYFKHCVHMLLKYEYLEPIGKFDSSYSQWNEFYKISSIGLISFIILGIFLIFINKNLWTKRFQSKKSLISLKNLNLAWCILFLFGITLLILNEIFQYFKLGIEKEKIFESWFLEMSVTMLISIVFPIFMYFISFNELAQRNNFYKTIFFIMGASALFSINILSRSVVVFWCMPLFFLPLIRKLSLKQYLYILILYVGFIFLTAKVSTFLRNTSDSLSTITSNNISNKSVNAFNRLLVDRWIGVEGLMVSIGIENKNFNNLFYERKNNEVDFFTENALNFEVKEGHKLTNYATLPGVMGYLYMSGSKVVLFIGCFLFILFAVLIERLILYFTQNFLLSSYLAISLASGIAGFGVDIMSWVKVQILTLVIVFLIYVIFIKFFRGENT